MNGIGTVSIAGSVESVIYSNDENGYTVLRLRCDDGGLVTVVGTLPYAAPGEKLIAEGQWTVHQYHGDQFKAESFERMMPQAAAEICSYLASGVIKGIGPATAALIVKEFREDTLRVIDEEPEALTRIKGINSKRAAEISASFKRQSSLRRLVEFFAANGIKLEYAMRLYHSYGDEAMAALNANPYIIADDFFGAGFADADRLALSMGFEPNSPERVEAAVIYELSFNANNGHCFIPRHKLADAVSMLIGVSADEANGAMDSLAETGEVVYEDIAGQKACYLTRLYAAEAYTAARLIDMASRGFDSVSASERERLIEQAEREMNVTLAENQRNAVRAAAKYGVFVLTGGPGTGKTTTIRAILRLFDKMGLKTSLAAPTGRAAKRMSQLCGREASTVHRLLETGYDAELGTLMFKRNGTDMLECDAVILDEASMVDITLMHALLSAMKPDCRMVLVGDADQLPSVGPGNMFADIIRSEALPAVRLTEVFRQAEESRIIMNAHVINKGEMPDLRMNKGDFFFLKRRTPEAVLETVLELCSERLPKKMGIMPEEIQVLSPTRRYAAGTGNLNRRLQETLNPSAKDKAEKMFGDVTFRTGDRVMQIRNNYDIMWTRKDGTAGVGVFNGDVGIITSISIPEQIMTVDYDDKSVTYTFDMLAELEPAYAITVHKAQGSEYRAVVLALMEGAPTLMSRSVLYTAATRAMELLIIVGNDETVAQMVNNDRTQRRYSGLKTRLKAGVM